MALPTLMGYNQCSWKLWHRGSDRACSSLQKEECWGERAMRVAMEVQVVKVATKVGRKVVVVALAATETTVVSEVIVVVTVANETE